MVHCININIKVFSLFIAETISIFDRNILSRGYPTKLEYYGNSGGAGMTSTAWNGNSRGADVGSLKQKCPALEGWIFFGTTH